MRGLALLLTIGIGCARPGVRTLAAPPRPVVDATLGAGDMFDVRVFDEQGLSGTYRVDPDGWIDYPLVGRIEVKGRLPGEIASLLRDKLRTYVQNPQISVLVREMNSKRVTVYGQVQKPGAYPYADPMTLSQAISIAGGFTSMAARERVLISRRHDREQQITEVDMRAILEGRAPNRFVSPGDEVYVPERLF